MSGKNDKDKKRKDQTEQVKTFMFIDDGSGGKLVPAEKGFNIWEYLEDGERKDL